MKLVVFIQIFASLTLASIAYGQSHSKIPNKKPVVVKQTEEQSDQQMGEDDATTIRSTEFDQENPYRNNRVLLDFGLTYWRYDYSEEWTPPSKSNETGMIPGITIGVDGKLSDRHDATSIAARLDYGAGNTHYDGARQDRNGQFAGDAQATTDDRFTNLEGDVVFVLGTINPYRTYIKGYTGLGFRGWYRGLGGDGGFREEYSWAYLPLGVRYETRLTDQWDLGVDAAAKLMFGGRIKVYLSDLGQGQDDAEGNLGGKPGFKLQVPVTYRVPASKWRLIANPFAEYSAIGQGDTFNITSGGFIVGEGHEPASRTYQYGLTLGAAINI